jgi:hypothetical protein
MLHIRLLARALWGRKKSNSVLPIIGGLEWVAFQKEAHQRSSRFKRHHLRRRGEISMRTIVDACLIVLTSCWAFSQPVPQAQWLGRAKTGVYSNKWRHRPRPMDTSQTLFL